VGNTIVQLFQSEASVLMVPSDRFGNSTAETCQFVTDCISKYHTAWEESQCILYVNCGNPVSLHSPR
jgi:hypothetical protein